jgi:hypothetical protein
MLLIKVLVRVDAADQGAGALTQGERESGCRAAPQ